MKKYKFLYTSLLLFSLLPAKAQTGSASICLNQLGFYTYAPKTAVVKAPGTATLFQVLSVDGRDTLFTGQLSAEHVSANSSLTTRIADFSRFVQQGHFVLIVPGIGTSYPFYIGTYVNHAAALASLKGYYYQRASMPLEEKYAGPWHRPAGHPDTAVTIHASAATVERPAGTKISTPGGWYDAGDYNKYIVNSGITMGTLFAAYEDFPQWFDTLYTQIPESGNGIPDVLDEALYNLRWMLAMQDPFDGGVYNKCTNAAFDGIVMPGVTQAPRYVVQKGTAATLDFAAVTAQAARIFRAYGKQLPGLADSCLAAAIKAWQWARQHPDLAYNQEKMNQQYEPKIVTGGYGDSHFTDEWFWAAAELLVTTKDQQYGKVVHRYIDEPAVLPSWGNVYLMGYYTLSRHAGEEVVPAKDLQLIREKLLKLALGYLLHIQGNAFQTVMGQSVHDFNWGSNANAANQGMLLVTVYGLTKDRQYLDAALDNLDYLLGRNATGYCFVTGLGSKSTLHPHHRPSEADGIAAPVPGLMAGGPNPGMQDHCVYPYTEPETAYTDVVCSFASNEIAINWNAPLVYLANAVEALQHNWMGRQ